MIHALQRGTVVALAATAAFVMVATATPAHAGGSSILWEAFPAHGRSSSIEGGHGYVAVIIIIVAASLAFGDTS